MATDVIHDQISGPQIPGTRFTVYHLMPYFLDPTATEEYICRVCNLTPDQVAKARAYVLNNPDEVLAQHLKIEERISIGNPPEVIAKAEKTHALLLRFKDWLRERNEIIAKEDAAITAARDTRVETPLLSFREWLAEQNSDPREEG